MKILGLFLAVILFCIIVSPVLIITQFTPDYRLCSAITIIAVYLVFIIQGLYAFHKAEQFYKWFKSEL